MLVDGHVDPPPAETNSLHLKAKLLFEGHVLFEADFPARAQDSLPRELVAGIPQDLNHLPVTQRIAGSGRDLRVCCDLTSGNLEDDAANCGFHPGGASRTHQAPVDFSRSG
jgi:hypothetical protein